MGCDMYGYGSENNSFIVQLFKGSCSSRRQVGLAVVWRSEGMDLEGHAGRVVR